MKFAEGDKVKSTCPIHDLLQTTLILVSPIHIKAFPLTLYKLLFVIASLLLVGCPFEEKQPLVVETAFYHWKSSLHSTESTATFLRASKAKRLYVKVFDVKLDEGKPSPVAQIAYSGEPITEQQIVPVVFITNEVWTKSEQSSLELLPDQILNLLHEKYGELTTRPLMEVQLDCDWTIGSKDKWFAFLRAIQAKLPQKCQLSVTIRLHQLKYPDKTGIPPCNRGMLMLYNTGHIDDPEETNSILSYPALQAYLGKKRPYPLPLDIALPVFQWGLVYRLGALEHIVHQFPRFALSDSTTFQAQTINTYSCIRNTIIDGYYLHAGDLLRLETADTTLLNQAVQFAQNIPISDTCYLTFYHLDTFAISEYKPEYLLSLADRLKVQHK